MPSRAVAVVLVALVICFAVGCGDDDDKSTNGSGGIPANLIGVWWFQSATIDGMPIDLSTLLSWSQGASAARLTVAGNGTCVYAELDSQDLVVFADTGSVAVSGDQFSLTPGLLPVSSGRWAVDDDDLTLTVDYLEHLIVVIATR